MHEFFGSSKGPFSNDFPLHEGRSKIDTVSAMQNIGFGPDPVAPSHQRDIVKGRGSQVREHFGQLTPPEEDAQNRVVTSTERPQRRQSRDEDTGKLSNEQRARNAANHRHHKSKKSRSSGSPDNEGGDAEAGHRDGKSLVLQREKNRVAAAKCRAKKKAGNEQRQEEARDKAAAHEYLSRHVRELRDERSRLRSLILAHNPDICNCGDIHQFNINEAQKLVFGATYQGMRSKSSASQESASPIQSPISDTAFSGSSFAASPRRMSMATSKPSLNDSAFEHNSISGMMHPPQAVNMDDQQGLPEFSEFLFSSPGGRERMS